NTAMYLGVDYYPEQWEKKFWQSDLQRMAAAGVNCIRIAEFAWPLLEKEEGSLDFSFFIPILEQADHYRIKVLLGTPTATLPVWLVANHPEVLSVDEYGVKRHFGGRRQACLNSPVYRQRSREITAAMAKAYSRHPAVVGWQLDNELGHEGSDWCYCHNCRLAWQKFLASEFSGDIDRLNDSWGTVFWGQTYRDFSQVDLPLPTIPAKNPGLLLAFYRFRAATITDFVAEQAAVLRGIIPDGQPIMHNFPGDYFNKAQNFADIAEHLDLVALNNYPVWGGLERPVPCGQTAMKLDLTRGLKNGSFWITEQLIGAQAHTIMGYLPRPGQARLWSWQAVLHGCDNLLYFRWRTATKGAEQFCYGVLDHDNRDGLRLAEMKEFFSEVRSMAGAGLKTPPARVALVYNPDNIFAWKIQPQSAGMDVQREHYRLYHGFYRHNVPIDVIDCRADFSCYGVVLLPVPLLLERELIERLRQFLSGGGVVISSFRAGIKDRDNAVYFNCANPWLEVLGAHCCCCESLGDNRQVTVSDGRRNYRAAVWRDMLEPVDRHCRIELNYTDEFSGYGAVATADIGQGQLWHVATGIEDEEFWLTLAEKVLDRQKIEHWLTPAGVEAARRDKQLFLLNHNSYPVEFNGIELPPWAVKIFKNAAGGQKNGL
ncbi:MAG: beta-galactosidase, partial [Negativicutes bacterium]|nr:beta-galactosidase [Negativicutes bacterium]